jgi:uncharacterized protein (TIGR02265 family)
MYTAQGAMFEGLFVRALGVDPSSAFATELRAAGFDVNDVRPVYPIEVWVACVDVAWRNLDPQSSRDEAWVELGRRFADGYFETFVGRAIATSLPLMSVPRFVERIPWFVRTGLGGSSSEVDLTGPLSATLVMNGPHSRSSLLLSGVLAVCFERLGSRGTFKAIPMEGVVSRLEISWVVPS